MKVPTVEKLSAKTGARAIQGGADALYYFVHDDDARIAIAAEGVVILTKTQAKALVREMKDLIDLYL
jgi:hypothetical protein